MRLIRQKKSIWHTLQKQDWANSQQSSPFRVEDSEEAEDRVATSRKSSRKGSEPMIFHSTINQV